MKPQTFVFIGRSGCGKGTQAALLMDWLKKNDEQVIGQIGAGVGSALDRAAPLATLPHYDQDAHKKAPRHVYYLETGKRFRQFIKGDGPTSKLSAEVYELGLRQPDFLAVWVWSHLLIDEFSLNDHLVADGFPRSLLEAQVFEGAMNFYKREKVHIIYMNVSRACAEERLHARASTGGRVEDKNSKNISVRLNWFDTEVIPAIKYLEQISKTGKSCINFHEIDGELTVDEVWQEIEQLLAGAELQ